MSSLKRERIKDQMMTTAARLWDIEESEIEQNFDPLILLMIEACAAELEKIGQQINDSHTRLIDYLAEIMLPGSLFGAIPASGILQATPLEAKLNIGLDTAFYLTQKISRPSSNNPETIDLYLSPISKFTLLKAELAYLMSGNKLFRIKENNSKESLFSPDKTNSSNELWIALNIDKSITSLTGLSIYFDLRGHSGANSFYNALSYAKGWQNENPVELVSGFVANEELEIDQQEILLSGDDRTNKINRKTAFIHQNRFLQIALAPSAMQPGLPASWKDKLPDDILKQLEAENLIFIRIELPQYFPQEVFDIVSCSINAFPAVNKKRNSFNYRTDEWVNIISIPETGAFFDLASVKNEKGEQYKIRPSAGSDKLIAGEAIVRTSGVGKTSSREVREMINNITETIRDQSAYFGQLSNEMIVGRLREIGKILAGLEDNMLAATDEKSAYHYLMLRPKKNGETVTIDYWITNGEDANNIKAGTAITAAGHSLVNSKKSLTLTNFTGGKNGVTESEKKAILRQQLISGGKIISAQDVKLLCFQLYGSKLKKVEVRKAVQVGIRADEGFKRTIDVILTYSDQVTQAMQTEMDNLCRELEFILQLNATLVYPCRIVISNPA